MRSLLFPLLFVANASLAEQLPVTIGADARVRHVTFNASDVIRVDTHLRVNTAIELPRGERINQVLTGDSESYEIEVLSSRNVVSIKPLIPGQSTNLTLYTNRRVITFLLTEGRAGRPSYRVVVNLPSQPASPQNTEGPRETGYRIDRGGAQSLRPLRVWNDGRTTFFEFPNGIRPSIFGLNESGFEITQNSQTRGAIVKVSGVREAYAIRIGEDVLCVRLIGSDPATPREVTIFQALEF